MLSIQWQSRLFHPYFWSGPETRGLHTVRALRELGAEVSVLTENRTGAEVARDEVIPGVWATRFPVRDPGRLWRIGEMLLTRQWYRQQRASAAGSDVVIACSPECVIASRLALPARPVVYSPPIVWQFVKQYFRHDHRAENTPVWARYDIIYRQANLLEDLARRLATAVIVGSDNVKRQLHRTGRIAEGRIHTLPYGVQFDRFASEPPDPALRATLAPQGQMILLYAGRLSPEKDLPFALQALSQAQHKEHIRLIVLGAGHLRSQYERLAASQGLTGQVVFAGQRSDVQRYYASADAFVLPSVYEAMSNSLLEAMAAGLPCLGRRSCYPRVNVSAEEVIQDGITGFCVDPLDPRDLAGAMDRLVSAPQRRIAMGRQAQEHCRTTYSWELYARRILDLCRSITRGNGTLAKEPRSA